MGYGTRTRATSALGRFDAARALGEVEDEWHSQALARKQGRPSPAKRGEAEATLLTLAIARDFVREADPDGGGWLHVAERAEFYLVGLRAAQLSLSTLVAWGVVQKQGDRFVLLVGREASAGGGTGGGGKVLPFRSPQGDDGGPDKLAGTLRGRVPDGLHASPNAHFGADCSPDELTARAVAEGYREGLASAKGADGRPILLGARYAPLVFPSAALAELVRLALALAGEVGSADVGAVYAAAVRRWVETRRRPDIALRVVDRQGRAFVALDAAEVHAFGVQEARKARRAAAVERPAAAEREPAESTDRRLEVENLLKKIGGVR